jgi:hypothetical protein
VLAHEIAKRSGAPLIEWHIKSTTKAHQGLYEYDAVARLRDGQLGDERVHDIAQLHQEGQAVGGLHREKLPVLLIDEIDKADIEFPNDLLQELDRMEFYVYETGETIKAKERPIVIITSNNEKELPDAFLRRCFFHYIRSRRARRCRRSSTCTSPASRRSGLRGAGHLLRRARGAGPQEEALDLGAARLAEAAAGEDMPLESCSERIRPRLIPPLHGALLKNEQDVMLFERLAFMSAGPSALSGEI